MFASFFKPRQKGDDTGEYELVSTSDQNQGLGADSSCSLQHGEAQKSTLSTGQVQIQHPEFVADDLERVHILDHLTPDEYAVLERRLLRKIDVRLMPCLFVMIGLNYLDRNALANARIQGIEESLSLKGSNFNTAISIFFIGYLALQIPSNILLTRVRPSVYLPSCMIAWGTLSGLTAFVRNFYQLATVRFFLGVVEAPCFPGALFLLSSWYTRRELAFRTSILYSGSLLSGAFGGLIGAGVQEELDGIDGQESWRWLFVIEASLTIIFAICVVFILPDYPHTTKFFTNSERAIATRRLQGASGSRDTKKGSIVTGIRLAITDYKLWLLALVIVTKTTAGAVTSFIPTLISTMSPASSKALTLLVVAPPYLFTTVVALAISYSSDHFSSRASHIIYPILVAALGFLVFSCTLDTSTRYASLFLILGGVYGSYNVALAWISSTLPIPLEKRSASLALTNTIGNIAQIYAPYMYLKSSEPRYLGAMMANVGFCLLCVGATWLLRRFLERENEILRMKQELREGEDDGEDWRKGFRYIL